MKIKLTILVLGDLDTEPEAKRFFEMLQGMGYEVYEQHVYGSDWFSSVDLRSERLDAIYVLPDPNIDAMLFSRFVAWVEKHSDFTGYLVYLFHQKEGAWAEVRTALSGLRGLRVTPDACPATYDSMFDAWAKEQPLLLRTHAEAQAKTGALKILWGGILGLSLFVAVWLAGTIQSNDPGWWYHWFTR